jgi:putative oxidoreductase
MDIGLFLIHVVIGSLLAAHGAQKLFGILGGHGLEGAGRYVESLGLRPGKPLAAAAGASELAGGALFALGLATPLAAVLIASTMLVAARTDHGGKGLWIFNGGSEYVLTISAVVIGLAFAGAGTWSLDNAIGWDVAGVAWGIDAASAAYLGAVAVVAVARDEVSVLSTGRRPR